MLPAMEFSWLLWCSAVGRVALRAALAPHTTHVGDALCVRLHAIHVPWGFPRTALGDALGLKVVPKLPVV